jgi:hypothetical protein
VSSIPWYWSGRWAAWGKAARTGAAPRLRLAKRPKPVRTSLQKQLRAAPRPRSGRPWRACCSGSAWDTPSPPSSAGRIEFVGKTLTATGMETPWH